MTNYGTVYGVQRPQEVEVTSNMVYVASNIEEVIREVEGTTETGYQYTYIAYTKDEYIQLLSSNTQRIAELEEQLRVTKILLGVD